MRKAIGIIMALPFLAWAGVANATVLGFDASSAFEYPRDGRFSGVGVDIAVNARVTNDLLMGYRVEELNVQGSDFAGVTGVANGAQTVQNSQITLQGVQGWYTLARALEDRLGADLGLWIGAATSNNFITTAGAAKSLTSPFIEPQARATFSSHFGAVEGRFWGGLGYRFIRNWNDPHPLGGAAGALGAVGAGQDRPLINFDGVDLQIGFGLLF